MVNLNEEPSINEVFIVFAIIAGIIIFSVIVTKIVFKIIG